MAAGAIMSAQPSSASSIKRSRLPSPTPQRAAPNAAALIENGLDPAALARANRLTWGRKVAGMFPGMPLAERQAVAEAAAKTAYCRGCRFCSTGSPH
jgi:hypothetical protein